MKHLRQCIRKLILESDDTLFEDKAAFLADMETVWHDDLQRVEDDKYGFMTARRDGRSVKTAWAQHVDREWVNDMIYVHYTDAYNLLHRNVSRYFGGSYKKKKKSSEISCEAFKSASQVKPYSNHGDVGLIIKGYVTLLGNDEDLMYTGDTRSYEAQMPERRRQSGTNKGVMRRRPDTYVLGAEDYHMPKRGKANEALLDNWEVVAILAHSDNVRWELIKKINRDLGLKHIKIIDPMEEDLNPFKNNRDNR